MATPIANAKPKENLPKRFKTLVDKAILANPLLLVRRNNLKDVCIFSP